MKQQARGKAIGTMLQRGGEIHALRPIKSLDDTDETLCGKAVNQEWVVSDKWNGHISCQRCVKRINKGERYVEIAPAPPEPETRRAVFYALLEEYMEYRRDTAGGGKSVWIDKEQDEWVRRYEQAV